MSSTSTGHRIRTAGAASVVLVAAVLAGCAATERPASDGTATSGSAPAVARAPASAGTQPAQPATTRTTAAAQAPASRTHTSVSQLSKSQLNTLLIRVGLKHGLRSSHPGSGRQPGAAAAEPVARGRSAKASCEQELKHATRGTSSAGGTQLEKACEILMRNAPVKR